MATSKKNTRKIAVKVQDLAPKQDPKGGLLSSLMQALHDTKKNIIANFRV